MALAAAERRAGKYLSLSLTASQGRARQRYFPALRSGFGSSRARYRKADKKVCVPPLMGRHVLYRDWVAAVWLMARLLGWRGLLWVGGGAFV